MNKKLKFSIMAAVLSLILLVTAVEVMFYYINGHTNYRIETFTDNGRSYYSIPDDILGAKPIPSIRAYAVKYKGKDTIYNATYTFDEYGRRVTPAEKRENRKNAILFFGCSYAYGEGVNDYETLPYFVSRHAPGYMPYNYAFAGYGTQNMLAKLQSDGIINEVNGGRKVLVYIFLSHHINRVIDTFHTHAIKGWGENLPYYTIDARGTLVRKGTFKSGRPVRSFFMSLLSKSQFVTYLTHKGLLEVPVPDQKDLFLTAKIIKESHDIFKAKFNSDEFYVLLFPGESYEYDLKSYLNKLNIKCLDYRALVPCAWNYKLYRLHRFDNHPNATLYDIVAKKLVEDLKIK